MKITKIIAAFMVAGLIGTAGCDSTVEEPAGAPDPAVMDNAMEAEMGEMEDPGEEAEEAEAPAEEAEAPAEEAEAPAEEAAAPAAAAPVEEAAKDES